MGQKPGGWSETKDATEDIQEICDQVKNRVEERTDKMYQEFKAVLYREQLVAGENFLIKVKVGKEDYLHLSVFRALPCDGGRIVLKGVQQHKRWEDPLIPFDCVTMGQKPGGWSETKDATEDIQEICDQVKVGKEDYLHLRVFVPALRDVKIELVGVQEHKSAHDPLVPF
ncbi:cystatin-A-like [Pungitius pungitius]|uniref:cystatin-A-like n=1 Tax=Pungitius pungitius TaxID=134920 RepID=UPI002E1210C0